MEISVDEYRNNGHVFEGDKVAGRGASIILTSAGVEVYKAGVALQIGRAFGVAGALVGSAIDGGIAERAQERGAEYSVAASELVSVTIKRSLMSGASLQFVAHDGTTFRFKSMDMGYGGVKKVHAKVLALLRQGNPGIADS